MAKGRSISKISKELETLVEKMKKMAKEYAEADGVKKQKLMASLKDLTKDKKRLEQELESSVNELDKDAQLQIDEMRKLIRVIIIEEIEKKSLNEIEFSSNNNSTIDTNSDEAKVLDTVMSDFIKNLKADKSEIVRTANDQTAVQAIVDDNPELKKINQQDEAVGAILIASIVAAIPKLIEHVGSAIKFANKLFKSKRIENWGEWLTQQGHKLHHKYIGFVQKILVYTIPTFKELDAKKQEKIAERVWMVIVAGLLVSSAAGAAHAWTAGEVHMAGIESALAAVKNGEIAAWISAEIAAIVAKA
jgi:hypothetical protein